LEVGCKVNGLIVGDGVGGVVGLVVGKGLGLLVSGECVGLEVGE
jgi:hypothetical protein